MRDTRNDAGVPASDRPRARFISEAECVALGQRAAAMAIGGGRTLLSIEGAWSGSLRYARNHITTSGDVRENNIAVVRSVQGAQSMMWCTAVDDVGLQAAVRRAERVLRMDEEFGDDYFREHFSPVGQIAERPGEGEQRGDKEKTELKEAVDFLVQTVEPYSKPKLFFDATYNLDAASRIRETEPLITAARDANLRAAGYIEVSAHGRGLADTSGRSLYYPYTQAQYSVTVRDPDGTGSGWAGVDFSEWTRIDAKRLSQIAMDKCVKSRNPVAIEPGRYTAILEPQAVCDLWDPVIKVLLDREFAEGGSGPFANRGGRTKIGEKVIDERVTLSADPMDPDLGFPPFSRFGAVYHPVNWIERGVLRELAYSRRYAIQRLGKNTGLPNSTAFRLSGGKSSIDEMISTTKRGVLVTRFWGVELMDKGSGVCTGYTRDGLWLIENGKISKAVKNFRFTESALFVFNKLETLGEPIRVFRPDAPAVVPPAKVTDFHFTGLSDAV